MKNLQAKNVLKDLVKGVHPTTGLDLPPDALAHDPTVIRALLAGVAALEADVARESRRKSLPPSIGRTWSDEEKQQLIDEFHRGVPRDAIAAAHGRTLRAIESRLEVMGLITAAERTTRNRFQSGPQDTHDS
jgi:hypothetical protein